MRTTKKALFSTVIAATTTILSLSLVGITNIAAAPADTRSGTGCSAANLNQAFDLMWDHVRVSNNATVPRWVVCPTSISPEVYDDGTGAALFGPSGGSVGAWFGSGASGSADVHCIWREVPSDTTGTTVTNVVSQTISADGPLPDTAAATFDISAFNLYMANTVTCRLAPMTGINTIQIVYNKKI